MVRSRDLGADSRVELRTVRGTTCALAFASRGDPNSRLVVSLERSADEGKTWSQDSRSSVGPGSPRMYALTDPLSMHGDYLMRACVVAPAVTPDPANPDDLQPDDLSAPGAEESCTESFRLERSFADHSGPTGESGPGGGDDGDGGGIGAS